MSMRTTAAMTALLLAATNLSAQAGGAHDHGDDATAQNQEGIQGMMMGGMMGRGMMGPGMMEMMSQGMSMMVTGGPAPAVVLRMGDALELTEDQVSRLEELRDELSAERQRHMNAGMPAHAAAREALQADSPDFMAYENALEEASTHMVQVHLAMARAAADARAVLTDEQQEQLQRSVRMLQGMMGGPSGMSGGMMQDMPR